MNLYFLLQKRELENNPVRVGIIGAGKFATMFMSQVIRTPGMSLDVVFDLDRKRARENLIKAGFDSELLRESHRSPCSKAEVFVTDDGSQMFREGMLDVVIESTGDPICGTEHAIRCIDQGLDVVMVNVEADVLAGFELAKKARENDVIYSLAYGDQPALIVEQVDTVRSMGLDVVCAGKGTKYMPSYHQSTPETVWDHYGLTPEEAALGGMNSKMFNSFLDGTKSSIEMTAVANATGLKPPADGLAFPACSIDDLSSVLIPKAQGGVLEQSGMVEVISSLNRDGSEIERDLRWGVYVVFEAGTEYVRRCFREYGLVTDRSGQYSALYRPYHLIGLELGVSVASVALRREPTGVPVSFSADVVSVAKRDLKVGDILDGEGGGTVWGKILPAETSLESRAVPIGLSAQLQVVRPIQRDRIVTWNDVKVNECTTAHKLRRQMEISFSG